MIVSWFSAGVSSAVATKLLIEKIDCIFYIHINDHHPDTLRFVKECEGWFGKSIGIMQSRYKTVNDALKAASYVNGPGGAPCTNFLKRRVRKEWEKGKNDLTYVWGMDIQEKERAYRLYDAMPKIGHLFPLIDKNISKKEAHEILKASGIKRPEMYNLGYNNNNCIGCVKGGMGYWNKIRRDFPSVFKLRAETERLIGGTCLSGVYLDELNPNAGRKDNIIIDDCGIFCEFLAIK
jgi:hypothetical protein